MLSAVLALLMTLTAFWAYTRLGHITDRDADGMRAFLNGGVTVTITAE